jgi:hypothetical protein
MMIKGEAFLSVIHRMSLPFSLKISTFTCRLAHFGGSDITMFVPVMLLVFIAVEKPAGEPFRLAWIRLERGAAGYPLAGRSCAYNTEQAISAGIRINTERMNGKDNEHEQCSQALEVRDHVFRGISERRGRKIVNSKI